MSFTVIKSNISKVVIAENKKQVSAMVDLEFTLVESDKVPVQGRMKHDVCIKIRPDAPKRRIMKRLRSKAINCQQEYFDGNDEHYPNIFSEDDETTLSINDEIELQQELLAIERELRSAA